MVNDKDKDRYQDKDKDKNKNKDKDVFDDNPLSVFLFPCQAD